MKRLLPLLAFVAAIACDAQEKQETVPMLSPEERIQELEARIASLEKIVGILSDELLARDGRYMLKAGDTGARVAQRFELSLSDMMALNPGVRWNRLKVGQIVRVKMEQPNKTLEPTPMAATSAAAHPPRQP